VGSIIYLSAICPDISQVIHVHIQFVRLPPPFIMQRYFVCFVISEAPSPKYQLQSVVKEL